MNESRKLQVRVRKDVMLFLEAIAEERDSTVSAVAREAIALFKNRYDKFIVVEVDSRRYD